MSWVAVIASRGFESFSFAALEAMACARPIIATSAGALPELIDNEKNGLLIPPAGAQTGASIQIVAPRNGSGVSGKLMVVEIRVQNFMLSPLSIGKTRMLGEGYWRVYVDGKFAGVSADEVISIPNDTFPSLPAGKPPCGVFSLMSSAVT